MGLSTGLILHEFGASGSIAGNESSEDIRFKTIFSHL